MGLIAFFVLLLVVLLAAALLLRERVASTVEALAVIAFVVMAVMALSALFMPGIYDSAADKTLKATGVHSQVQQMDEKLSVVNQVADLAQSDSVGEAALEAVLQSDAVDSLLGRLGLNAKDLTKRRNGSDNGSEPESPVKPTRLIEDNLYPGLVSMLGAIYRVFSLITSVAGMIGVVALAFAASVVKGTRRTLNTVADLEQRVAQLEASQGQALASTAGQVSPDAAARAPAAEDDPPPTSPGDEDS